MRWAPTAAHRVVCVYIFFSSHFSTHIYSVKRSRHNVWTLCINLIELQLFFETLESIRRKVEEMIIQNLLAEFFIRASELAFQIVVPVLLEMLYDLFDLASHSIFFFWRALFRSTEKKTCAMGTPLLFHTKWIRTRLN